MRIKKNQYLSPASVRSVCVRENLYTRGDNREYSAMFDMVQAENAKGQEFSTESLYAIASDIAAHSDSESWKRKTGSGYENFIEQIMLCLYEKVQTSFEIVEG